jgi:hypothetical protein
MTGNGARRRGRPTPAPRALVLVVLAGLVAPGSAHAHPAGDSPAPGWVPAEEVPVRSEALFRRLKASRRDAATHAAIERIERELPAVAHDLEAVIDRAREAVRRAASPIDLGDIEVELVDVATPLRRWKAALATEGERVAKALDDITRETALWSATRDRPETAAAGEAVVQGVARSIAALDRTADTLNAWRARMLAISVRVLHRDTSADLALENLEATMIAERTSLLVPDRSPLSASRLGDALRHELPASRASSSPRPSARSRTCGATRGRSSSRPSSRSSSRTPPAGSPGARDGVCRPTIPRCGCSSGPTRSRCCSRSWRHLRFIRSRRDASWSSWPWRRSCPPAASSPTSPVAPGSSPSPASSSSC